MKCVLLKMINLLDFNIFLIHILINDNHWVFMYSSADKSQIYIIDSLAFKEACIEKAIKFQLVDELIYFKMKHTIVLYNGH